MNHVEFVAWALSRMKYVHHITVDGKAGDTYAKVTLVFYADLRPRVFDGECRENGEDVATARIEEALQKREPKALICNGAAIS